ncbi:hypothetical protein [Dyadobacter sp. CY326]|uniref:hypothetical protein n=1 Tax=Dyadobacter sp. CY326 TaxID=2907300 RepID=UPI001F205533|nr:hypothetical protein [Dyadobacter sp. CY326]MCE7065009.1 hypothetical protein [Dyadobacter sp. CY326]
MKKKNENIDKYRHDRLPEPEIPADDAWAQMDGILSAVPTPVHDAGVVAKLLKIKWALLSASAVTIVSAIILIKTTQVLPNEKAANSRNDTSAVITENEVAIDQPKDFAKPTETEKDATIQLEAAAKPESNLDSQPEIARNGSVTVKSPLRKEFAKPESVNQPRKSIVSPRKSSGESARTLDNQRNPNLVSNEEGRFTGFNADKSGNERGRNVKESNGTALIDYADHAANLKSSIPDAARATFEKKPTPESRNVALRLLRPKSQIVNAYERLTFTIKIQAPELHAKLAAVKMKSGRIQFGPEWGMTSPLAKTNYLFAGRDSVNKPALLLIPGIFVSKSWQQHVVSFTFSPYQSYFGNGKIVVHALDSITANDSLKTHNNKRLMKASGMNFSLYYHFQASKIFALGAGASYSIFSNALVRNEIQNYEGRILPGALSTLTKKSGLAENINPRLFALKAGIVFTPGRFQVGLNVVAPVTSVSRDVEFPLKSLNGQLFLRFNCFSR